MDSFIIIICKNPKGDKKNKFPHLFSISFDK